MNKTRIERVKDTVGRNEEVKLAKWDEENAVRCGAGSGPGDGRQAKPGGTDVGDSRRAEPSRAPSEAGVESPCGNY